MKALVTGATGFLGSHCVVELLRAGHEVRGTVRELARGERLRASLPLSDEDKARLTFVLGDLSHDEGWAEAMRGCDLVLHVASPVPSAPVADADEVVGPARDGTLRVLGAAAAEGVKRVVMTSSTAAVLWGHARDGSRTYDERDWSNLTAEVGAYERSKTLAERAAWDFVAALPEPKLELVTILPGAILGPLFEADFSLSGELVRMLLDRKLPGIPDLGFALVDVRDVARIHVEAATLASAAGERFIVAGPHVPFTEIARALDERFGPRGYRVPRRRLPSFLVRMMALWDRGAALTARELGKRQDVSSEKASRVFGWKPRPLEEMVSAMGESMIEHGVIGARHR